MGRNLGTGDASSDQEKIMAQHHMAHAHSLQPSQAPLIDPVCGMSVTAGSPHHAEHAGQTFGFCSASCMRKFQANPERYARAGAAQPTDRHAADASGTFTCPMHPEVRQNGPGTCPKCGMALEPLSPRPASSASGEWTCPMHPEIVQDHPGTCPICGMALEPRTISAGSDENPELVDMRRRFRFATALTLPLLVVAMGDMLPGHPISSWLSARGRVLVELALATPVCLWSAWPFYQRAMQSVRNKSLNMFTLIGLGVSVAYTYSLVAALLPDLFPAAFRHASGEVPVYFEAAGVIVTLILLGQVLELRARSQTSAALKKLLGMAPKALGQNNVANLPKV
jgi:Cu+-exporting ATPase